MTVWFILIIAIKRKVMEVLGLFAYICNSNISKQ